MTINLIIFLICFVALGYLGGLLHGYNKGVDETEDRWSDFVRKENREQCPICKGDRLKPYKSDR
jgi:hypothetical protein